MILSIGKKHGPEAEKRIRKTMDVILANHEKPVMEKLKLTNDYLNNIPWIADPDLWKRGYVDDHLEWLGCERLYR